MSLISRLEPRSNHKNFNKNRKIFNYNYIDHDDGDGDHKNRRDRVVGERINFEENRKLKHSLSSPPRSSPKYAKNDVVEERKRMYKSLQSLSCVLDSSGEYRILSFISHQDLNNGDGEDLVRHKHYHQLRENSFPIKSDNFNANNVFKKNDLSIVTHGTLHQLSNLDFLAQKWNGPISVAVFAVSVQQLPLIIEAILLLRYCNPLVRERISFNLVYPLNFSNKLNNRQVRSVLDFLKWPDIEQFYPEFENFISNSNCINIERSILKLIKRPTINYDHDVAYPNNLLRNIARRNALTEYTLVIDLDLVPSENLYEKFIDFAKRTKFFRKTDSFLNGERSEKTVFVIPTFEIDLDVMKQSDSTNRYLKKDLLIPADKSQLMEAIDRKFIRPFYIELCWKCQKHTDYIAWIRETLRSLRKNSSHETDNIDVMHEVFWRDPWEPFYISSNDVPFYDERFRQYGFNRISQVCELNVAGYSFQVLRNAFLIHKGFKKVDGFHSNKNIELEHNRNLFRKFKIQLKDRYPKSTRKC
ncbi:N-acetyllactosaminide beta-1,3-N-acetylglucosaminyltransferase-like protein 2 [Sarcoptes scabiei]|uniref:Beta-1,4-glucuronyltransferase 1 n=2 Tax=Sarcoptes scabiei TaxID=52283 RepID=A0A132ABA4_SARSC|nr:N-acetyllactosaminide beta-1,3-N-acetylglucosaminyltransferase-like protein 2 [Sarcoptes scabiei]